MCKGFLGARISHLARVLGCGIAAPQHPGQMQKYFTYKSLSHAEITHLLKILHLQKCFTQGAIAFSAIRQVRNHVG